MVLTFLPFAAPLFMRWGWQRPATLLYTIFDYTCYHLRCGSWFLFGPRLIQKKGPGCAIALLLEQPNQGHRAAVGGRKRASSPVARW
jgi:hypothetical protein